MAHILASGHIDVINYLKALRLLKHLSPFDWPSWLCQENAFFAGLTSLY